MVDRVQLPKDKHLAQMVVQADAERHKRDMGKVGEFFGSKENATIYLAELLIFFALLFASIIAYADPILRPDALKAILAIATLAVGYMFGSGSRRRD